MSLRSSHFMSMSKSWTPKIRRGDTKRRSFYSALVYSCWSSYGLGGGGGGGMPAPSPQKSSFCFSLLNFHFLSIADEIRAFLDSNVEGSGAEKSLIQYWPWDHVSKLLNFRTFLHFSPSTAWRTISKASPCKTAFLGLHCQ